MGDIVENPPNYYLSRFVSKPFLQGLPNTGFRGPIQAIQRIRTDGDNVLTGHVDTGTVDVR
jgi:hypothetical protein